MLFIWIFGSLIVGIIASSKNRNGFGWGILSLFLSPLLGLIAVLALPEANSQKCPYCKATIAGDAIKCKYCASDLE